MFQVVLMVLKVGRLTLFLPSSLLVQPHLPNFKVCTELYFYKSYCNCHSQEVCSFQWRLHAMAYDDFPIVESEYDLLEETFTKMRELAAVDQIDLLGKTIKPVRYFWFGNTVVQ